MTQRQENSPNFPSPGHPCSILAPGCPEVLGHAHLDTGITTNKLEFYLHFLPAAHCSQTLSLRLCKLLWWLPEEEARQAKLRKVNYLGLEFLDPQNLELRKEHILLTLGTDCSLERVTERGRKGELSEMCPLIQDTALLCSGVNCTESRWTY